MSVLLDETGVGLAVAAVQVFAQICANYASLGW
jgi:hypothetical protein